MTNKIRRPPIRFHGSQWQMAPWIVSHMVEHESYVEPFCGSAAVFFNKSRVKLETLNDLNGRITNYFSVLRDHPDELIRLIELTPWSEIEYNISSEISEDPLEDARRFHVLCWMSFRGGPIPAGFRMQVKPAGRNNPVATDMLNHDLWNVSERLRGVQILQKNALDVLKRFSPIKNTLIYVDPPYLPENRVSKKAYGEFEIGEDVHFEIAKILNSVDGLFLVSGYQSALYRALYEDCGWKRADKLSRANSGCRKVVSLWISPMLADGLLGKNLPLFNMSKIERGI